MRDVEMVMVKNQSSIGFSLHFIHLSDKHDKYMFKFDFRDSIQ